MTVSEEVKEAVLKFKATRDYDEFRKFVNELDIDRDGMAESRLACKYLLESLRVD